MQHMGLKFVDREIELDDNDFDKCSFKDCNLIYRGGPVPSVTNCSFDDDCRLTFDGCAANAVRFLASLHQSGFGAVVERTFNSIRGNPGSGNEKGVIY